MHLTGVFFSFDSLCVDSPFFVSSQFINCFGCFPVMIHCELNLFCVLQHDGGSKIVSVYD